MALILVISGHSDDLIEIESNDNARFPAEEFNILDVDQDTIIAVSDGTVLRVRFDEDSIWRFTPILTGVDFVRIELGIAVRSQRSDRVILSGDNLSWVVLGSSLAKSNY